MEMDDALKSFLNKDDDAMRLKKKLDEIEAARKTGQEIVNQLVFKYNDIKTELERAKLEFHKHQSVRHLAGNEVYDNQGRVLIPELERQWFTVVKRLEDDFFNIQCQVHRAEEELKQLISDELNATQIFECAFQTFCEKLDNVLVVPRLKENTLNEDIGGLEWVDEIEPMKSKFVEWQMMMKRMIQVILNKKIK